MGASGFRSSRASIARNSVLRRSATRSASSISFRAVMRACQRIRDAALAKDGQGDILLTVSACGLSRTAHAARPRILPRRDAQGMEAPRR